MGFVVYGTNCDQVQRAEMKLKAGAYLLVDGDMSRCRDLGDGIPTDQLQ
jgi:hypothetical protein